MSVFDHPGSLILARLFVRKAMELELEITEPELIELWAQASEQEDDPQEADLEVDGESMDTDWDEPATDWMTAKKTAVRTVIACLVNDAANLPQIGRRVERIVRRVGTADIYFDDGSFVSATVSDPPLDGQPKSCGCKKACFHAKKAVPVIDMVAAVYKNELLGTMDIRKHGARDSRFWGYKVDGPFELFRLTDVPLGLARALTDFPTRMGPLRSPRHAWSIAQDHVDGRAFKRLLR